MKRYGIIGLGALFLFCFAVTPVLAAEGKPCPVQKVVKKFWCETCKGVREFNECPTQAYVWDWQAHKGEKNPHMGLQGGWACQTAGYYCIRCGKCFLSPGICNDCNDDTESRKDFSKVVFKCPDGHNSDEPGTGFALKAGLYEEEIQDAGKCPTCGKPLAMVCTKSGTCPHQGK